MANNKLLAAALLKDDLDADDKMYYALFAAAFEELDDLRKKLAQIPIDVDASAFRFEKTTTVAVDDFISVANEALSKFTQRTNELKGTLDLIEKTIRSGIVVPSVPSEKKYQAPPQRGLEINSALWWIIPCATLVGLILGSLLTYAIFK